MVPYKIPQVRYTVDGNVYYLFNSIQSHEAWGGSARNRFLSEILIKEETTTAQLMEQERNSYCLCRSTLTATCFTKRKLLVQYHNVTEGWVMPVLQ